MSRPPSPSPPSVIDPVIIDPVIPNPTTHQVIDTPGIEIVITQGPNADGNEISNVTLITTDATFDNQITENLTGIVKVYDDEIANSTNAALVNQIKLYAGEIKCTDFHGKGSIDDYAALFNAAATIANESQQMALNVDIDGFNEFAQAADDLSQLFTSFIVKLQNVNIIDDTVFLTSIALALSKIVNLSNVFGKFKETILATSTIQLPKSAHDTATAITNVMTELNCAMNYISYFVNPDSAPKPTGAALSTDEQNAITTAVNTIDTWNTLCEQGVTISLANNVDIQAISKANTNIGLMTGKLSNLTSTLKTKLATYNIKP